MKIFELDIFGFTLAPTYYGLMYIIGFLYGIWALKKTGRYTESQRESLFLYIFAGVLLGGRIGYILFYDLGKYISEPSNILRVWEGGMSFHGGFLGVVIALVVFAKLKNVNFWKLADDIALIIPVGLFFGRIGNYLNKELLGFPYTGPLAVQISSGSYFPSPLLEAFLEGLVIFVILKLVAQKIGFDGKLAALFLILYGTFRTIVELFFRVPDPQIGYYFGFLTQGSLLSIPMILVGIYLYFYLKTHDTTK
ncbi:prolipoprotein diacylglyceryl transferase [Candidatus Gracilibacteria bacterium]|nr:prolipoprotein diacylglyceryl transferase [Candidatus Gracilibacteria bacterium]